MVKKKIIVLFLIMVFLPLFSVSVKAQVVEIGLEVDYFDPTFENGGQRSPIHIPQIGIDCNTLFFNSPCDNCTLRLINEDYEVDYSAIIPSGTHTMVLPSYLSGEYRIEIIRGNFCFWGYILL